MAKSKRPRNYKQVEATTADMGSSGGQVLLGSVSPLDVQGTPGAYLNNVVCTALLNDDAFSPETELAYTGGFIIYLSSTDGPWSDNQIITARGISQWGGTCSLSAKRRICSSAEQTSRDDGEIYIWAELTDITLTSNVYARFVFEAWGRFIELNVPSA